MRKASIAYVRLESACLSYDVKETVAAGSRLGRLLAAVGEGADEALVDLLGDADPEELRSRAARLRGAALHGAVVLADLQACAGRLEQIASVLEAVQG